MIELKVNFHGGRIFNRDKLEVIESYRFKIKITPCFIDSLFVSLLEKWFSIYLNLFCVVVQENTDVLAPCHKIVIIFESFSVNLVALET